MAATATASKPTATSKAANASKPTSKPKGAKEPSADPTTASAPADRPHKPDETTYRQQLEKAEKEHAQTMQSYNKIKAQIDMATGKKGTSPNPQRRQILLAELGTIREKQGGAKNERTSKLDQIKKLEELLRSRQAAQKELRSKMEFKSEEELDAEIKRLDNDLNSGKMKLVDEMKARDTISRYRKLKKSFSHIDSEQKEIDSLKSKIAEIKKSMEDPESKQLSDRYNEIQKELDELKMERDEVSKNLNTLRAERSRLQDLQSQQYASIKKIKDDYYDAKRAFKKYEDELSQARRKRKEEEYKRTQQERRLARAREMLAEASDPAYLEELRRAEYLWHFFDPSHEPEFKKPVLGNKSLESTVQRTIDDSAFKGMKVIKKDDEEFMPAANKGKKGKKTNGATTNTSTGGKFSCPPVVMEDCTFLGIRVPAGFEDVPDTIDQIKKKIEQWKADQDAQTQKNIAKAKKEIARLEASEDGEQNGNSEHPHNGTATEKNKAEEEEEDDDDDDDDDNDDDDGDGDDDGGDIVKKPVGEIKEVSAESQQENVNEDSSS